MKKNLEKNSKNFSEFPFEFMVVTIRQAENAI